MEIKGEAVYVSAAEIIGEGERPVEGYILFTPHAKHVFELSLHKVLQLSHSYISTEYLLLGLFKEGEGMAAQVLTGQDADLAQVHQTIIQMLSDYQRGDDEDRESVDAGVGSSGGLEYSNSVASEQFDRNLM